MGKPRRSTGSWQDRQDRDPFVQKARREGWRSRAVFKLEELLAGDGVLRPGATCIDLGAAPGGWSQYVARRLGSRGRIVAVDLLPVEPLTDVTFIRGDFTESAVFERLLAESEGGADLVLSDMAPNLSGTKAVDQPRSMYLAELALDFARRVLRPGGSFVCKVFQGAGYEQFVADARASFGSVRIRKPKASRPGSSETYLVARNYQL